MGKMSTLKAPHGAVAAMFVFVCMVACCSCAHADGVVPAKLTLAGAISTALETHPRLEEAEANYLSALSNTMIAGLKTSVDFGSEASLDRAPGEREISNLVFGNLTYEDFSGTEARLDLSPFALGTKRGSIGVSVRRPLMKGKGTLSGKYDRLASAKSEVTVRDKRLFLSRQETMLRVTSAYFRAVKAREQVKVQEKAVEIAGSVADAAKRKADAGYAAGIEATRAELRVADVKNELQIQQQAAKGALEALMLAIGAGVGETPELVDSVPEQIPEIPSIEEALDTALKNRSELVIADEQIANQERLLAIAKDQLRPSLDLVAGFNSVDPNAGLISTSILDAGAFAAGVQYRVPLDRRAVREEHQIASRELETMKKLREYQLESIAEEVGRAYRAYQSEKTSLAIYTSNLATAQENLELANRMLIEANYTNRDVLEAQEALTRTEGNILSARTELYLAALDLKDAMGEDLGTQLSQ